MRNRIIEAAERREFMAMGQRSLYGSIQVLVGSAIIAGREATGLELNDYELMEKGIHPLDYDSPYEVGRMPLRFAMGSLATAAVLTVAKIKGWT